MLELVLYSGTILHYPNSCYCSFSIRLGIFAIVVPDELDIQVIIFSAHMISTFPADCCLPASYDNELRY